MRRILIALTLLCSVFAAPVAVAQETATPEKVALVKRYFEVIEFRKLMSQVTDSMVPALLSEIQAGHPDLTAKEAVQVREAFAEATNEFIGLLIDDCAELYAAEFTLNELQQMVAFYESPVGRSITVKAAKLTPQIMEKSSKLIPEYQRSLERNLCSRIDCDESKEPQPKA